MSDPPRTPGRMPGGSLPPRLHRPHLEGNGHGGPFPSQPPPPPLTGRAHRPDWAELDAEDSRLLGARQQGSELRRFLDQTVRVHQRVRTLPSAAVVVGLVAVIVLMLVGYIAYRAAPSSGSSPTCQASTSQPAPGTSLRDVLNRCASSR